MDIPDVRIVIILFLVPYLNCIRYMCIQVYLVITFCRIRQTSGRAGQDSVSHLIVNTRLVKNSSDVAVKSYCTIGDKKHKEYSGVCRRRFLCHLGDNSHLCLDRIIYCDQCTRDFPYYMDSKSLVLSR